MHQVQSKKIGSQVKNFKQGDEVFTRPAINRNGTYAEYVSVKASEVAVKPKSISHIEAASIPLAGITAYEMLHSKANIKSDDKVLIHAGSGGVGTLAIQIAKAAGCYVATTTSTANVELVKILGADEVIDYKTQNFVDCIRDYDVVLDTLGGQIQEDSWQVLRKGGVLVSIVSTPSEKKASEYGVRAEFLFIGPNVPVLNELSALIEAGKLKPVVGKVFPLSAVKAAHYLSESGRAVGKICLQI